MAASACTVPPAASAVEFVEPLDENLMCQICYEIMIDPRAVKCGHCYCRDCILKWMTRGGDGRGLHSCPLCRKDIDMESLRPIPPLKAVIEALRVYCRYKTNGCRETVPLGEVEFHSEKCVFASVECLECSKVIIRHSLESHLAEYHSSGSQQKLKDQISYLEKEVRQTFARLGLQTYEIQELKEDKASLEEEKEMLEDEKSALEDQNELLEEEKAGLKSELEQLRLRQNALEVRFDGDYRYGDTPESVLDLARFISYHFHDKPLHINRNWIFDCVARCRGRYMYGQNILNIHMLLAVAAASNWFSDNQSSRIQEWLESCPHSNYGIETDDSDEEGAQAYLF